MDIKYLKREFGKEETLRTIDVLGHNGGYICAPSQEVMPNVPVENIQAFLEAVKEARGS